MIREPLSFKHIKVITEKLHSIPLILSEFSFANLYFFREKHNYHFVDDSGTLYIEGITYDKKRYLMPLEDLSKGGDYYNKLVSHMDENTVIFPVTEEWLHLFPKETFSHFFNEDDSDYLYLREKMATYSGKKLQKKRNLLKQFLKLYTPKHEPLTEELVPLCLTLLMKWHKEKPDDDTDYLSCLEALELFGRFNLTGGVIYADETVCGFYIGENQRDSYTIHFAKADTQFKGVYQFLFQQIAENRPDTTYLNMEQDVGLEGLRQNKRTYIPIKMLEKYRVSLSLS